MDERKFEFLAEIPEGSRIKVMRNGDVLIAHPDHPLKCVKPNGETEIIEPWPTPPKSPTSAHGSK
jgi:hypothetical protein